MVWCQNYLVGCSIYTLNIVHGLWKKGHLLAIFKQFIRLTCISLDVTFLHVDSNTWNVYAYETIVTLFSTSL